MANKYLAARDLSRIHPDIVEAFNKPENTFYVFDSSTTDNKISGGVLPYELATCQPCICLDFESFWALRLAKTNNKWLIWEKDFVFPEYLQQSSILGLLYSSPPITFDPNIKEIMGVPVEYMA